MSRFLSFQRLRRFFLGGPIRLPWCCYFDFYTLWFGEQMFYQYHLGFMKQISVEDEIQCRDALGSFDENTYSNSTN